MEHWKKSNRYIYHLHSGYVYDAPTLKGNVVSDLVLGDLFEVEAVVHKFLKIRMPDNRAGYVLKADCLSFGDWSNLVPDAQSIISVARQMMGFPARWGGTSSKSVDCSGLVKLAYYSQGVILARDASQQARYGESLDFTNLNNLQPGDLLFFGRSVERITHVGIYLGNGNFIHASGKVHIGSIIPGDPKYNPARNNVAARRILNSLNTEGIVRVKDHPWFSFQP
jgi:gamma-D-glutamyl-L-lysine dipeptidyl-peptidase